MNQSFQRRSLKAMLSNGVFAVFLSENRQKQKGTDRRYVTGTDARKSLRRNTNTGA